MDDLEPSKFERGKHPVCTGTVEFFLRFVNRRSGNDLDFGIHLPGTEDEKHIFRIDAEDGDSPNSLLDAGFIQNGVLTCIS
ncbi:MAG: hypothetical protein VYC97_07175 [SAR324 cluster bacterium]|nr:hypothetical protein [SAR324 cluster bacterium]